jgi:hypothetical protein
MIRVEPARYAHVNRIANRMRPADVDECRAMGFTPKAALRFSLSQSDEAWTAFVDDVPEAMFGLTITNALCGKGRPWMLGTEAIYRHPRDMLRGGRIILKRWLDSTPYMENLISTGNDRAIRMLRRWGCQIGREVIVFTEAEFVTFTLER